VFFLVFHRLMHSHQSMIPPHILKDNVAGSSVVTDEVINWISDTINTSQQADYTEVYLCFDELIRVFPHFASLHHLLGSVKDLIKHRNDTNSKQGVPGAFRQFLANYKETWQFNQTLAAEQLVRNANCNTKTLMLHSHSGSVIRLFEVLAKEGMRAHVIQTVSEPVQEGKAQAVRIANLGFQVRVINEAAAGRFMPGTDMLVTGADVIYRDCIVNKTGTLPLALLCRQFSKPWFILADSRKLLNSELSVTHPNGFTEKPKPAKEIWTDPPRLILPVNFYFEDIPRSLATSIFTEKATSG